MYVYVCTKREEEKKDQFAVVSHCMQYGVAKMHRMPYHYICDFPQKSPTISGSFAEESYTFRHLMHMERDLQVKAYYESLSPCIKRQRIISVYFSGKYQHAVCCSVLQCVAVCCSVLQCVAVCCSVLQCVAVCCSVLQSVAECCSVLQCVTMCYNYIVLQCT